MPLGQKDEMSQNTCDMEHNHLNIITPRLGIPDKASAKSRLNIEITHSSRARHAVCTHAVIRLIIERVDIFSLAPI